MRPVAWKDCAARAEPVTVLMLVKRFRKLVVSLATAALLCMSAALAAPAPVSSDETTLERNFDALIHPDEMRNWMKLLAAEPNHVSSPHDKTNADQILAWFKDWGWDAHIETFWVLIPKPISETLELVAPQSSAPRCKSLRSPAIPALLRLILRFLPMSLISATAMSLPGWSTSIMGCRTTTRCFSGLA